MRTLTVELTWELRNKKTPWLDESQCTQVHTFLIPTITVNSGLTRVTDTCLSSTDQHWTRSQNSCLLMRRSVPWLFDFLIIFPWPWMITQRVWRYLCFQSRDGLDNIQQKSWEHSAPVSSSLSPISRASTPCRDWDPTAAWKDGSRSTTSEA